MVPLKENVTMQGKPLTLEGNLVKVGQQAPNFEVIDTELKLVSLSSFHGQATLILSVPSLDTSVCSTETHKFNQEINKFGKKISVLTISMDLPFAQKRWCGSEGAMNLKVASDHLKGDFGQKYGVMIKELRLLARAVFLVDQEGVLRYVHLVKEITSEPPYEEIYQQISTLLSGVK